VKLYDNNVQHKTRIVFLSCDSRQKRIFCHRADSRGATFIPTLISDEDDRPFTPNCRRSGLPQQLPRALPARGPNHIKLCFLPV
jgi:hypothetical protein